MLSNWITSPKSKFFERKGTIKKNIWKRSMKEKGDWLKREKEEPIE